MIRKVAVLSLVLLSGITPLSSQQVDLTGMDDFRPADKNWQIAGDVNADLNERYAMTTEKGTGVLVNIPNRRRRDNLLTKMEHGDIDLELEFMMAAHSNSGIYLQGRYEVQLLDSWGVKTPKYGDCGGIYQRRRPDGSQFEGHAPRINACRAPGLWQKMEISFQAPRFDEDGNKTGNAKILKVVLNGYTIHENIELTGPTGGPISQEEAPAGPIMIQGDHGPVAFRNIRYSLYDQPPPEIRNLRYQIHSGDPKKLSNFEFDGLESNSGEIPAITWMVSNLTNEFGLTLKGDLNIRIPGDYKFHMQAGGVSRLKIDGQPVIDPGWSHTYGGSRAGAVSLEAGDHSFEITYAKVEAWIPGDLAFRVEGPRLRLSDLHDPASFTIQFAPDQILLDAPEPTIHRSFMRYNNGDGSSILVRAVNVGHEDKIHYTYDLASGAIVQVWRGRFLDVTPMWDNRGNGQSIPDGSTLILNDAPTIARLENTDIPWPEDQEDRNFNIRGYEIDEDGFPKFNYELNGSPVTDRVEFVEGKYIVRELTLTEPAETLYVRLAEGEDIKAIDESLYLVDDKSYYIRLENKEESTPEIRTSNGRKELIVPITGKTIRYSLIW